MFDGKLFKGENTGENSIYEIKSETFLRSCCCVKPDFVDFRIYSFPRRKVWESVSSNAVNFFLFFFDEKPQKSANNFLLFPPNVKLLLLEQHLGEKIKIYENRFWFSHFCRSLSQTEKERNWIVFLTFAS